MEFDFDKKTSINSEVCHVDHSMPSISGEHSNTRSTFSSNAIFSEAARSGIAAMRHFIRGLHRQSSLMTSFSCNHNCRLIPISYPILSTTGTLQESEIHTSVQPVCLQNSSFCFDNSVTNLCISSQQIPVYAFGRNLTSSSKQFGVLQARQSCVFPQLYSVNIINAKSRQFWETPSVLRHPEMPKRKRSHSEHSRSKHKDSRNEKSRSTESKKKCDNNSSKSPSVPKEHDSKEQIGMFIGSASLRRKSKRECAKSASATKSSRIDDKPHDVQHTKNINSVKIGQQSIRTRNQPVVQCGFTQRDFSTSIPSYDQKQDGTYSSPPFTISHLSASTPDGEKQGGTKLPLDNKETKKQEDRSASSASTLDKEKHASTKLPLDNNEANKQETRSAPSHCSTDREKHDGHNKLPIDCDDAKKQKTRPPSFTSTNTPDGEKHDGSKLPLDYDEAKIQETKSASSQGQTKPNLRKFRRHWRDSSLGRRHKIKTYPGIEFVVMSYNLLAQNLIHTNDYLYRHCPKYVLDWDFRKNNLMSEIADIKSDIVCLQEVTEIHFTSFYQPEMLQRGYTGLYKQRTSDKQDGCATFYKTSRFKLIDFKLLEYRKADISLLDRDNVAVLLLLQPTGQCQSERICVANTHLLYNPKRGDIKLAQLGLLLAEIDKMSHIPNSADDSPSCHPVIMCGDFNSVPQSSLVNFIESGALDYEGLAMIDVSGQEPWRSSRCLSSPLWPSGVGVTDKCQYKSMTQQLQIRKISQATVLHEEDHSKSSSATNAIDDTSVRPYTTSQGNPSEENPSEENHPDFSSRLEHSFRFSSSYPYHKDSKEVTTNHTRTNCKVDYIFYSSEPVHHKKDTNQLRVLSRLSLFTDEEATSMGGLPNARWSSDHYSLAVQFLLTPNNAK